MVYFTNNNSIEKEDLTHLVSTVKISESTRPRPPQRSQTPIPDTPFLSPYLILSPTHLKCFAKQQLSMVAIYSSIWTADERGGGGRASLIRIERSKHNQFSVHSPSHRSRSKHAIFTVQNTPPYFSTSPSND